MISNDQNGGFCTVKLNHTEIDDPNKYTMIMLRQCQQLSHVNTADAVEVAMLQNHLSAWFKIRQFRRREFRNFIKIKSASESLIKLFITGLCGNDLIYPGAENDFLTPGSNIVEILNNNDLSTQLGGAKIYSLVLAQSYWEGLLKLHAQSNMFDRFVENIKQFMATQGHVRFLFEKSGLKNDFSEDTLIAILKNHGATNVIDVATEFGRVDWSPQLHRQPMDKYPIPAVFLDSSKILSFNPFVPPPHSDTESKLCTGSKFCVKKTYVVNLQRRQSRYEQFKVYAKDSFGLEEHKDFERFDAVDGQKLAINQNLKKLFRLNDPMSPPLKMPYRDHGFVPGVIGCSLSNIKIWEELAANDGLKDNDAFLILEDDVWLADDFLKRWKLTWQTLVHDSKWNWIYLGYSTDYDLYGDKTVHPNIKEFSNFPRSIGGGTFGYAIRKKGASALLRTLYTHGVQSAIDWFMIGHAEHLGGIYKCSPHLVYTTGVFHMTSDTTSEYPKQILIDKASEAVYEGISTRCKAQLNEKVHQTPILHLDSFGVSIGLPQEGSILESGNISVTPIIELRDGYEERHFYRDLDCASVCVQFESIEGGNFSRSRCVPIRQAGSIDLDVGQSAASGHLFAWIEDGYRTRLGDLSIRRKVSLQESVVVSVTSPLHLSSTLPTVNLNFEYEVVDNNNINLQLWRLCLGISSPWYLEGAIRSFPCQAITPELVVGPLPYGLHTLHVELKGVLDTDILYKTNQSFYVVPTIPTEAPNVVEYNVSSKRCKGKTHRALGEPRSPVRRTTLLVLAYRQEKSLKEALKSWDKNGLLSFVDERIIFFQNCATCASGIAPPSFRNLLEITNFKVIGSEGNVGISKALASLVERSTSQYVIFLEEDWQLVEDPTVELNAAMESLMNNTVDMVKLRHSKHPGHPYCSSIWKGYEHLMVTSGTDGQLSVLNAAAWQENDELVKAYFGENVWRCSGAHSRLLCSTSPFSAWTNNPSIFPRSWFLKFLHKAALAAAQFESAINLSPHLWNERCFHIGQGTGLFSHVDLDKDPSSQSPCEVPLTVQRASV